MEQNQLCYSTQTTEFDSLQMWERERGTMAFLFGAQELLRPQSTGVEISGGSCGIVSEIKLLQVGHMPNSSSFDLRSAGNCQPAAWLQGVAGYGAA